jgi:hypothetical protein
MKLALKFPYKTLREIRVEIIIEYNTPDQLRKLMYAFSNEISDILLTHYKITLNELFENDKLFKNNYNFNDKEISISSQYSK